MDFTEKWGDSVESATQLALEELQLSADQVEVTVLEEPSKGFFGIGSKLAKVRVEKKKEEKKPVQEAKEVETVKAEPVKEEASVLDTNEVITKILAEDINYEELEECTEHAGLTFVKEMTAEMKLDVEVKARKNDKYLLIDIDGKDSGTIIGKRGQTLDAIQYLTSLVVNKDEEEHVRVIVDSEHYRAKREKTLENLANRLADKVLKNNRPVKLEPMNPYERKVIHSTLQKNEKVTTRSEGQDPYRRVIIEKVK